MKTINECNSDKILRGGSFGEIFVSGSLQGCSYTGESSSSQCLKKRRKVPLSRIQTFKRIKLDLSKTTEGQCIILFKTITVPIYYYIFSLDMKY